MEEVDEVANRHVGYGGMSNVDGAFRGQTLSKVVGGFRGQTQSKVVGAFRR